MIINVLVFMIRNKARYQKKNINCCKWWILTILAMIFPTHFVCLATLVLKISYAKHQTSLSTYLQDVDNMPEFEETQRVYSKLCESLDDTENEYVILEQLKQSNSRCETVLETLPSTILLISLGVMSVVYERLKLFMTNDVLDVVIELLKVPISYKAIVTVVCIKAAFSCIFAVIKIRNAKRLPLKPSFLTLCFQLAMTFTLFLPKIGITSLALVQAPYFYPIMLIVEYLMILCYNWIFFGSPCGKCIFFLSKHYCILYKKLGFNHFVRKLLVL